MRIAKLKITNFQCFAGEHVLELESKVYAIVARMIDDAERSNWLGKSTLLEAIFFCLTGEHRQRTEDEFITRGADRGGVEITFDDGVRIARSRDRGKRTTIFYYPVDASKAAIQDEAEAMILERVGLSAADAKATYYFQQKQMAKFVTSDPAERMKMVAAWFRLEPLEACEARVRELAAGMEDSSKKIDGHLSAIAQREVEIAKAWPREKIVAAIPEWEKMLALRAGAIAGLEDELEKNATLLAGKARIVDFEQVIEEGKKVKAELDGKHLPVLQAAWKEREAALMEVTTAVGILQRDAHQKQQLARGEFDGKCPVAGIECPARAPINASFEQNRNLASAANAKCRAGAEKHAALRSEEQAARAEFQAADRIRQRLDGLREQAGRLKPLAKAAAEAGEGQDPVAIRARLEKERGDSMDERAMIERLRGWLGELDRGEETRTTLAAKRAEIEKQLGTYREAAAIFGKRGAQRRVAEGALGQIEDDANEALKACGVGMVVEVRWSREGKGLASACEGCGHPFPSSAKAKNCERCGAARGPKLENKLEIVLSDRSGAAEDLAGGFVQLAASRWLRAERGTVWSTALLDEPFGALDAAHRRGFSAHLAGMLSGRYGFEQAFVVAHHASVLDALPGRIEIVSDGKHSTAKVVA